MTADTMSKTTEKLPHEITLTHKGKKGEKVCVARRCYCPFRANAIKATDSLGGRATLVRGAFIGNSCQFTTAEGFNKVTAEGIVSADLNMAATGRPRFDTCDSFIDVTFIVDFLDDCEWSCTLSGEAFKEAGDTEESMRARAIEEYRRANLRPDWGEDQVRQFQKMLERL